MDKRLTARCRTMRRARAALVGGLAFFVATQLALNVVLDGPWAAMRDLEFGEKLCRLQARLKEAPERPFLLVLGSSRSANGVLPSKLAAASTAAGHTPLVFNFGLVGCGPVQELMLMRRLLRRGIRPDRVLIEVHPALLHQEPGVFGERIWMQVSRMESCDLDIFHRYLAETGGCSWRYPDSWPWSWWHGRLVPAWSHRISIFNQLAPLWLEAASRQDYFKQIDALGWMPSPFPPPTEENRRRWSENARNEYARAFERYRVTALADRALRELLEVCRGEGIAPALLLMPEGSNFRGWYPPGARHEINNYLTQLHAEFGARIFDAMTWCDDDDFADGHHLLSEPAARFSERLGRELEWPVLARQPAISTATRPQPSARPPRRR